MIERTPSGAGQSASDCLLVNLYTNLVRAAFPIYVFVAENLTRCSLSMNLVAVRTLYGMVSSWVSNFSQTKFSGSHGFGYCSRLFMTLSQYEHDVEAVFTRYIIFQTSRLNILYRLCHTHGCSDIDH